MELRPNIFGEIKAAPSEKLEMFYMRVGKFRFRQAWIEREVSPSLTFAVAVLIALGGFLLGFGAARWWG